MHVARMAHDFNTAYQGEIGYRLAGQPAVGNSRLADMDVLSVSWKQPADLSPWYGLNCQQGSLLRTLTGVLAEYWMFSVYNVAGIQFRKQNRRSLHRRNTGSGPTGGPWRLKQR